MYSLFATLIYKIEIRFYGSAMPIYMSGKIKSENKMAKQTQ